MLDPDYKKITITDARRAQTRRYGCLTVYVIFPWLLSRSSLNKCYVVGMLFACAYLSPWHTSSDPCTVSNQVGRWCSLLIEANAMLQISIEHEYT